MKKLIIKNLGPLSKVKVELGRVNLIIGLQSSGKSCILKTACHCSWVEKRIELIQTAEEFLKGSRFLDALEEYFRMHDFVKPNTYIEYESSFMWFAFDNSTKFFDFHWKPHRWDYHRPKISYVPSDRNLVAAIPIWSKLPLEYDNLLDFMKDWDTARKRMGQVENILNTGMSYSYDNASNNDSVILVSGKKIRLSDSSSGIQSLFPLFVHLGYLFKGQFQLQNESKQTYEQKEERLRLTKILANHMNNNKEISSFIKENIVPIDGNSYFFSDDLTASRFKGLISRYLNTNHNEIFLEEPEDNLFPPTQCQLIDWLLDCTMIRKRKNMLFMATHSPYVLNQVIKHAPADLHIFITNPNQKKGLFTVKQLADKEILDVYDNGADLFFNYEAFV